MFSFRVCELLLERERDFEPILECYLLDPLRRSQAFTFLRNVLGNQGYLTPDRAQHLLVENIKVRLAIDLAVVEFSSYFIPDILVISGL